MAEEAKKKFTETKGFKIGSIVVGIGYSIGKEVSAEKENKIQLVNTADRVGDEIKALRAAGVKENDPTMIVTRVRATWALRDLKNNRSWPYGSITGEALKRLENELGISLEEKK